MLALKQGVAPKVEIIADYIDDISTSVNKWAEENGYYILGTSITISRANDEWAIMAVTYVRIEEIAPQAGA